MLLNFLSVSPVSVHSSVTCPHSSMDFLEFLLPPECHWCVEMLLINLCC